MILCKLLGHKLGKGYAGGKPYLRITNTITDGIGRIHAFMDGQCNRCNQWYRVANTHITKEILKEHVRNSSSY